MGASDSGIFGRRLEKRGRHMLSGKTRLIANLGFPIESVKASLIYNPWFEQRGIDACVVPMGVTAEDYPVALKSIFRFSNVIGACITMPHKITSAGLVDELSTAAKIAGSVNAIFKRPDGSLVGDMFDGTGFTRGVRRKGFVLKGARCLVVGCGGVGSAIAASLAAEGVAAISLFDAFASAAERLASRLHQYYPAIAISLANNDPAGHDLVVNCTPMGMQPDDPLPFDPSRLASTTFVGEVIMKQRITPILEAAIALGCPHQVGIDMLFEMIPAYLEFFGFGSTTPEELRAVAQLA